MKLKFAMVLLVVAAGVGAVWYVKTHSPAPSVTTAKAERKILYYQSSMHPWIKSDKPGKCPICGMDLVPVYEGDTKAMGDTNLVALNADSVSAINVQTETVRHRAITHTRSTSSGASRKIPQRRHGSCSTFTSATCHGSRPGRSST